jgi:hypothetical protein
MRLYSKTSFCFQKKLTRNRSTSLPLRNQKSTIKPDMPNKRTHVLVNTQPTSITTLIISSGEGKTNAQEIPPGPPKSKDKKDGEDETGNFARIGVGPASDKRCTDQARTEVSRREGEPEYTACHACRASPVRCGCVRFEDRDHREEKVRGRYSRSSSMKTICPHVRTPTNAWLIYFLEKIPA